MPVSDEYAARTPCRYHTLINTQPLRGSLRGVFLSQCETARMSTGCKHSHTIFNTNRVHKLGGHDGRSSYVVYLNHGHGFERYGSHDSWDTGWEVEIPGYSPPGHVGFSWVHDLPKALLKAEACAGLKKAGDTLTRYEKKQSLCRAHHDRNGCRRQDCKFDHDLVDSTRIEKLVRGGPMDMGDYEMLTVECRVVEGQTTWKVILKNVPFAAKLPSQPYSHEGAALLDVVRHMERVVKSVTAKDVQ